MLLIKAQSGHTYPYEKLDAFFVGYNCEAWEICAQRSNDPQVVQLSTRFPHGHMLIIFDRLMHSISVCEFGVIDMQKLVDEYLDELRARTQHYWDAVSSMTFLDTAIQNILKEHFVFIQRSYFLSVYTSSDPVLVNPIVPFASFAKRYIAQDHQLFAGIGKVRRERLVTALKYYLED